MIKYTPLQALKVDLSKAGLPSYHVLILPDADGYQSFYLISNEIDYAKFMFSCAAEDDAHAVEIAVNNAPLYLPEAYHDIDIVYCKDCHWGYVIEVDPGRKFWRCGNPSHNTEELGFCHRAEKEIKA